VLGRRRPELWGRISRAPSKSLSLGALRTPRPGPFHLNQRPAGTERAQIESREHTVSGALPTTRLASIFVVVARVQGRCLKLVSWASGATGAELSASRSGEGWTRPASTYPGIEASGPKNKSPKSKNGGRAMASDGSFIRGESTWIAKVARLLVAGIAAAWAGSAIADPATPQGRYPRDRRRRHGRGQSRRHAALHGHDHQDRRYGCDRRPV
jgi:hypothetical protein